MGLTVKLNFSNFILWAVVSNGHPYHNFFFYLVYLHKQGTILKINICTNGKYDGCITSLHIITKYLMSKTADKFNFLKNIVFHDILF